MDEFVNKLIEVLARDTRIGRKSCEAIVEDIQQLAEEHNGGWIPVSERLPNEEEMRSAYCRNHFASEFIVMIKGARLPTTLYRTRDGFWMDDNANQYQVTAWQPLPAPYKERDEGTKLCKKGRKE